jgi:hypothetical protein
MFEEDEEEEPSDMHGSGGYSDSSYAIVEEVMLCDTSQTYL